MESDYPLASPSKYDLGYVLLYLTATFPLKSNSKKYVLASTRPHFITEWNFYYRKSLSPAYQVTDEFHD